MQFQTPQFIDVEDKIFGPLTFKQFIYVAGGVAISYILYSLLPLFLAILFIIPIAAFSIMLAFYKMNGKPFIKIVETAFRYAISNKLYLWRKEKKKREIKVDTENTHRQTLEVPKLASSKLKELSWSLDVHKEIQ